MTPVGEVRLGAVLDDRLRLVVSNRTFLEAGVEILAVALAIHANDGTVRFRMLNGLSLGPQQSDLVDDDRPGIAAVTAVEALVRLFTIERPRFVDAYTKLEAQADGWLARIELGIVTLDGDPRPEETPIPYLPEFAVFARTNA